MKNAPRRHCVSTRGVTLGQALEAFRLRCQARNLTHLTCGWYEQVLGLFQRFLEARGVTHAREITPNLVLSSSKCDI